MRELKSDSDIVILKADKGNATVVMDSSDYESKVFDLLADPAYETTTRNPLGKIEATTKKLINQSSLLQDVKKRLIVSDARTPAFYGLPKIHKPDVPLRPIVSAIGSPTHTLAKYLNKLIQPAVPIPESQVKNTEHFIEILQQMQLHPDDILVSFDVVSLFTRVPVQEALQILQRHLGDNETSRETLKLTEHCITTTFFSFRDQVYVQKEGAAMGSPLSPLLANIFMAEFEKNAIKTSELKPKYWYRYVDDTFVVWSHGREKLEDFWKHLNSLHPNIEFTMEVENERKLPFLDVLVTRKEDNSIDHSVYRKTTHTDRYLKGDSHHPPSQKKAVINTLVKRARTICSETSLEKELLHLTSALEANGYTKREIGQVMKSSLQPKPKDKEQLKHIAVIPYIKGTSDQLARLLRKHNIFSILKPINKIEGCLTSVKDKTPAENLAGVYKIPCSCSKVYIGQTGRRIITRVKEHIRDYKKECLRSAIAEHSVETKHSIEFDQFETIVNISNYRKRYIREAIEISKHPYNMNREDGYRLSNIWTPLLKDSQSKNEQDTERGGGARASLIGRPTSQSEETSSANERGPPHQAGI